MAQDNSGSAHDAAPTDDGRAILIGFNEKVTRLESTRFYTRYRDEPPSLLMKFDRLDGIEASPLTWGGGLEGRWPAITFSMSGYMRAWIEDFDQDAVEAFVLTYRLLTQDNDRYSVRRLAKLYDKPWMDSSAREHLAEARQAIADNLAATIVSDFGGGPPTVGQLLDIAVYGGLAHSNAAKETVFRSWTGNPTKAAMMWTEFMAALRGLMRYFLYIRDLNSAVLHVHFGDSLPPHIEVQSKDGVGQDRGTA